MNTPIRAMKGIVMTDAIDAAMLVLAAVASVAAAAALRYSRTRTLREPR